MTDPSEHPCARCARMQRTCCQRAEILVTGGDIARIARHTGRSDFWSRRRPDDPAYLEGDPDDPLWQAYTSDRRGRRRMLLRRGGGDCVFLGPEGCSLPADVRPLVCRLYPFAYTERGLAGADDSYCPTHALLPAHVPGATMLTVLGMPQTHGERWRTELYAELHHDLHNERRPACASA